MAMDSTLDTYIERWKGEGRGEGRVEGRGEGLLAARREDLLELVAARFGEPPPEVSALIQATTDQELLRAWHRLAARASLEDVTRAIRTGQAPAPTPRTA